MKQIFLTEVAVGLHCGLTRKECAYNFFRTLINSLNGLFAVVILASCLQRLSGNVRPTFLSFCPNACLWPETTFKVETVSEDVKHCYNGTAAEVSRQVKDLIIDSRLSFPSLQEALSSFCTVFVTGLWHRKRTRKLGHVIGLVLLTLMSLLALLLANAKLLRHQNWLQDILGACLLGFGLAVHQLICLFGMDNEQDEKCISNSEELQMQQIVIPRVRYRRSLVLKKNSPGLMNPCFVQSC